ncbi:MAG TPA: glycosyltransferase family 4 protein [Thermodesulfobacteriota bacterium]
MAHETPIDDHAAQGRRPGGEGSPLRVRYYTKGTAADPGSRYRAYQYAPRLAAHGVTLDLKPLFGDGYVDLAAERRRVLRALRLAGAAAVGYARRLADLAGDPRADLVVIERQLFPYWPAACELACLRGEVPVVLEFDDAIYLTPGHRGKLARLLAAVRLAIVGNASLADFAGRFAREVAIVPTVVDVERYRPRLRHEDGERFVVGWIGLPYNFPALERLAAPLARLAREVPLELHVVSRGAPRLPGVPVREVPWSEATEADLLARLDVGVMPLPDDEWSRGKCGLKLLQYMAAGIPAVASPVGVNREIVADGENGRLASTEGDWYEALRDLARSPALRARLGAAGRRTVEQRYSLEVWAPRVAALYRSAAR